MNATDLPELVLLKILEYLSYDDIFNVYRTCRRMQSFIKANFGGGRKLSQDHLDMPAELLGELLDIHPSDTSVTIMLEKGTLFDRCFLLKIAAMAPSVRELCITGGVLVGMLDPKEEDTSLLTIPKTVERLRLIGVVKVSKMFGVGLMLEVLDLMRRRSNLAFAEVQQSAMCGAGDILDKCEHFPGMFVKVDFRESNGKLILSLDLAPGDYCRQQREDLIQGVFQRFNNTRFVQKTEADRATKKITAVFSPYGRGIK